MKKYYEALKELNQKVPCKEANYFNMVFATLEGMEFIFAWMNFYGRKNKIMLK